MSVKMFALTNDIYIWIFCALHTVFRWFLGSFDTADDGRTTFSNTIRLFDLIFAYISQAGLFFVCLYVWVLLPMAFGWCVLQRVYTVLCRTFKPKLHLICQKMYYKPQKKRVEVAKQKESVQYKQAYRPVPNWFFLFYWFFFSFTKRRRMCALSETKPKQKKKTPITLFCRLHYIWTKNTFCNSRAYFDRETFCWYNLWYSLFKKKKKTNVVIHPNACEFI